MKKINKIFVKALRIGMLCMWLPLVSACGSADQWIQALGAFGDGLSSYPTSSYSSTTNYVSAGSSSYTTSSEKEWHNCSSCAGSGRCKYCSGSGRDSNTRNGKCGVCVGTGKCAGCNGKGGWKI